MVAAFVLPGDAKNTSANSLSSAYTHDQAIQYANTHWNWKDASGSCCAAPGDSQWSFACAEFVSRALASEGYIPGLNESSPQSQFANYPNYNLINVGSYVNNIYYVGLYEYLMKIGAIELSSTDIPNNVQV